MTLLSATRRPIRKLVQDPSRVTILKLWRAMTTADRELAVLDAIKDDSDADQLRGKLALTVAQDRGFRLETVLPWSDVKLAKWAARAELRDSDIAWRAIASLHLIDRQDMLVQFLDRVSVPHDRGRFIDDDGFDRPIDSGTLSQAAGYLLETFPPDDVLLYLLALRSQFSLPFASLDDWFATLAAVERNQADGPQEFDATEIATPEENVHSPALPSVDLMGFTTLDRRLIMSIVDAAAGVVGAESQDEIDDLLLELEQLNGRRHTTFFHIGFRDALFDREAAESLAAENEARRRWYWAGMINGLARRDQWTQIATLFKKHQVVGALGGASDGPCKAAVTLIFRALTEAGRFGEAAAFVQESATVASKALRKAMLDTAVSLIRNFRAAEAKPLLDKLARVMPVLETDLDDSEQAFSVEVLRRRALCLRQLGEHREALAILRDLTASTDPMVSSVAHTDIGLIQAGIRRLGEIKLPQQAAELTAFIEALSQGERELVTALATKGFSPAHANFALGVLALARGATGVKGQYEEAGHRLDNALAFFSGNPDVYRADGTLGNAQLYLGAALCLGLEDYGRLPRARELLTLGLDAGATIPVWLVRSTIDSLAAARADLAIETASVILDRSGNAVLDELAASDAAPESDAVRLALFRRAASASSSLEQRSRDYRMLVPWLIRAQEIEKARDALNFLEAAALDGAGRREFVRLLDQPAALSPAWDSERVADARLAMLEVDGRYSDAAQQIEVLCYRLLASDNPSALDSAALLLTELEGYGDAAGESLGRLRPVIQARLERREREEAEESADAVHEHVDVRILVVGGSEMQAKMDEDIRATVRACDPGITVEFLHSGWSSNWSEHADRFVRLAAGADGVVFLQMMRTMFGRRVRAQCHLPWRACRGRGQGQIVQTILRVAPHARERLIALGSVMKSESKPTVSTG